MERMRVIVITVLLFISVVVAEDAGAGEAIKPTEVAATSDAAEDAGTDDETSNLAKHDGMSLAINQILNGQTQAYESPRFMRFVTHCSSHVTETCSGNDPMKKGGGINGQLGLFQCLFDSMEACLVDHKASLYQTTSSDNPKQSIQYLPVLIQTVKFQSVLRTCSHFTAQSCLTGSNVDSSALSACLLPYLNWCVYPTQMPPPPPPPPPPPIYNAQITPDQVEPPDQVESDQTTPDQVEPHQTTPDQVEPDEV